jgi:hypothetical protein
MGSGPLTMCRRKKLAEEQLQGQQRGSSGQAHTSLYQQLTTLVLILK